jgi:glycerate kinase
MRVVIAPDKFRGSLSATDVVGHVGAGLRRVVPGLEVVALPMADGGEGTLEAALAVGFEPVDVDACGPTGEPVRTAIAVRGGTAVIESAAASGSALLPGGRRDALRATSRGTGDLIRAALDAGCATVVLGVGGSACTDGGAGLLAALGARFLGRDGRDLADGGGALTGLARVELSGLDPRLASTRIVLASDVDNPLLGPSGAAAVYGPQKGASAADVRVLEAGLGALVEALAAAATPSPRRSAGLPGAGAAGGIGFAVLAVLGGRRRPGVEVVADLVDLSGRLSGAALVITGEGSLDEQTLHGKTVAGVAAAARAAGVPAVAVAGRSSLTPDQLAAAGLRSAHALTDLEPDPRRCMAEAGPLLERLVEGLAGEWVGRSVGGAVRPGSRHRDGA